MDINRADLKKQREMLKDINKTRNLPEDAGIACETDGRYNNPMYVCVGKTPTHTATQQVATVSENASLSKKIVAACLLGINCARRAHSLSNKKDYTHHTMQEHWAPGTLLGNHQTHRPDWRRVSSHVRHCDGPATRWNTHICWLIDLFAGPGNVMICCSFHLGWT